MSCLDNIVTLGICPDDGESLSGFTLLNAAGMNLNNLAKISTNNVSGAEMALQVKSRSILQVRNDFLGMLQSNAVIPTISQPIYDSGNFFIGSSVGTYAGYRGVNLYRNNGYRGSLRKTIIEAVELYPTASGESTLKIFDGLNQFTYPITLVANQVNVFNSSNLDGFPFVYTNESIRVTVDQSTIPFLSAKITCMKGCDNTMPNPCGWADGWDGTSAVKSEGYGVNVKFKCECDYEKILCDLSKSFIGELIWLKWQYNIFDEQYKSNRFESIVIHNREDLQKNIMPDIENQYNAKWNNMMNGILSVLKTYRDDCLNCQKAQWRTNI